MTLYAVHIQGPDDIIAAPGEREAQTLAKKLNAFFMETLKQSTPATPMIEAVVIKWPYAPTAHAEELAKDWADHAKFIGPIEPVDERDTRTIDMFSEQAS
ncbi:hypothetical protein G3N95_29765 [Paraburkholderia sp. Tr-20389]|uniref:hypothetical protein n=1 Tax=Paraburkholderia sp. Tr-20389 TaxID=2703903 RepID=UPI00197D2835|nr:hypothetical protein [Paraburkholderia sp. Tr-20389]MBN3757162.1 hypothetical protein [Paraburkholderia sp. Tr-20389]